MKFGDPEAMLGMAGWHMTGAENILPKNEERAFYLVQQAAEQKLPRALYTLGYFYEGGIGIPKNVEMAFRYYNMAADQGNIVLIKR